MFKYITMQIKKNVKKNILKVRVINTKEIEKKVEKDAQN